MTKLVNLGMASLETKALRPNSEQIDGAPLDEEGVLYRAADPFQNPDFVKVEI